MLRKLGLHVAAAYLVALTYVRAKEICSYPKI
jgi:hypothetical protein